MSADEFVNTRPEIAPLAPINTGAVRIEGVVKKHGQTTVLHGIDLAIEPGEFFVLLGPSGSGKTTTLRILAGLEAVNAGHVLMDGADVTTREPGERDVAMVFQSYELYPHMTVEQNTSSVQWLQTRENAQRRRLARSRRSKQREKFPRLDVEIEPMQRGERAVPLDDAAHADAAAGRGGNHRTTPILIAVRRPSRRQRSGP